MNTILIRKICTFFFIILMMSPLPCVNGSTVNPLVGLTHAPEQSEHDNQTPENHHQHRSFKEKIIITTGILGIVIITAIIIAKNFHKNSLFLENQPEAHAPHDSDITQDIVRSTAALGFVRKAEQHEHKKKEFDDLLKTAHTEKYFFLKNNLKASPYVSAENDVPQDQLFAALRALVENADLLCGRYAKICSHQKAEELNLQEEGRKKESIEDFQKFIQEKESALAAFEQNIREADERAKALEKLQAAYHEDVNKTFQEILHLNASEQGGYLVELNRIHRLPMTTAELVRAAQQELLQLHGSVTKLHPGALTKEGALKSVINTTRRLTTEYPFIAANINGLITDGTVSTEKLLKIQKKLNKLEENARAAATEFSQLRENATEYQQEKGYEADLGKLLQETSTLVTNLETYKKNLNTMSNLIDAYKARKQFNIKRDEARALYTTLSANAQAIGLPYKRPLPNAQPEDYLLVVAAIKATLHERLDPCIQALDKEIRKVNELLNAFDGGVGLQAFLQELAHDIPAKVTQAVDGCILTDVEIATLPIIFDKEASPLMRLTKAQALLFPRRKPASPKNIDEFLRLQGVDAQKQALQRGIFIEKALFTRNKKHLEALAQELTNGKRNVKLDQGVLITIAQLLYNDGSRSKVYQNFVAKYLPPS